MNSLASQSLIIPSAALMYANQKRQESWDDSVPNIVLLAIFTASIAPTITVEQIKQ